MRARNAPTRTKFSRAKLGLRRPIRVRLRRRPSCDFYLASAIPRNCGLMRPLRLDHRLPDFSAAIKTLIDEVDLRHAPMRLDVSHIHMKVHAARTGDEC